MLRRRDCADPDEAYGKPRVVIYVFSLVKLRHCLKRARSRRNEMEAIFLYAMAEFLASKENYFFIHNYL